MDLNGDINYSQLHQAIEYLTTTDSKNEFRFGWYRDVTDLAMAVFGTAKKKPATPVAETTNFSETLTVGELNDVLNGLNTRHGISADLIYKRVKANRDNIKYKAGDILRSPMGNVFIKRADGHYDDSHGTKVPASGLAGTTLTLIGRTV